jgi:hypothetical protein
MDYELAAEDKPSKQSINSLWQELKDAIRGSEAD